MMENLKLYEALRVVPKEAKRDIQAGRLKGKTDINPMWRIKAMTEQLGPCGIGWKYTITGKGMCPGNGPEVAAFVDIDLYIKVDGEWSEAIPGTGGSMFVASERNGPYTSDECYKMALTDAISVACKALGVAADVYWDKDSTKYDQPREAAKPASTLLCEGCGQVMREIKKRDGTPWPANEIATYSKARFGKQICPDCQKKAFAAEKA